MFYPLPSKLAQIGGYCSLRTNSKAKITLVIGNNPGSNTLSGNRASSGSVTLEAVNGIASFSDLSINHSGGGTLSGTKILAASDGVATFSALSIEKNRH